MAYSILNGRVQTRALECHIVDHCNLTCANCCSFSPYLPKWMCTPEQFEKDLLSIKRVVQPQFLKIVGGEPLLHPQLVPLLQIARRVSVAERISITTNAHRIAILPDEAWTLFDMLTVSIYPSAPVAKEILYGIHQKAKANHIEVSWKIQDKFVNLNRQDKSEYQEAKATFNGCWIHHRCNSVRNGRFYSCTRPQYIQHFAPNPERFEADGIDLSCLDEIALALEIKTHLESAEPLNSCYLCNGGNAAVSTHQQLDRRMIPAQKEALQQICNSIE